MIARLLQDTPVHVYEVSQFIGCSLTFAEAGLCNVIDSFVIEIIPLLKRTTVIQLFWFPHPCLSSGFLFFTNPFVVLFCLFTYVGFFLNAVAVWYVHVDRPIIKMGLCYPNE